MSEQYSIINIRTYLDKENASLAGYFSLAIKPISVKAVNISKTMTRKLSRVSILDETSESYCTAAYLIAQLGKNYTLPKSKRIDGSLLLEFASATVMKLKYSVGGVMEFLNDSEPHQPNHLLKIL